MAPDIESSAESPTLKGRVPESADFVEHEMAEREGASVLLSVDASPMVPSVLEAADTGGTSGSADTGGTTAGGLPDARATAPIIHDIRSKWASDRALGAEVDNTTKLLSFALDPNEFEYLLCPCQWFKLAYTE